MNSVAPGYESIVLTTHAGLEGLVSRQAAAIFAGIADASDDLQLLPQRRREPFLNYLWPRQLGPALCEQWLEQIAGIHYALRPVVAGRLVDVDPLDQLRSLGARLPLPLTSTQTFRVTGRRYGEHSFSSEEAAAALGAGIAGAYQARARMRGFDLNVRLDINDQQFLVSLPINARSYSKAAQGPYQQSTSLKPSVAWALLEFAAMERHGPTVIYDPFCGAGTILMAAAKRNAAATVWGSDWREAAADGALANLQVAGFGEQVNTFAQDARLVRPGCSGLPSVDHVVTNPPYGVKLGQQISYERFYGELLGNWRELLSEQGTVTILVYRRGDFERAARRSNFRILRQQTFEQGGTNPTMYHLGPQ